MERAQLFLQQYLHKQRTPSIHYAIFDVDNIIHEFRDGFADIGSGLKITNDTTYNAYSVTKTFTALAILQLVEQGKLRLGDYVRDFLPLFPYGETISIRHLLTHTSGIPNPIPLNWIHLAREHESFNRDLFFEEIVRKYNTVKTKPGEKFSYSNLGYVFLGTLIEKVASMSYERYIIEYVLKKLAIAPDALGFTISDHLTHARGYHDRFSLSYIPLGLFIDKTKYMDAPIGRFRPFKDLYVNGVSYGGLIGTPSAFVEYTQALLRSECQLVSDDYKKILFTENHTNNGKATGMCLSWFCGELCGHRYVTHAGGGGGYYCEVRLYPDLKIGSVIFLNRTGMTDERLLDKVDKFFIEHV